MRRFVLDSFKFRTSLLSHSIFDIWNVKKYGASSVDLRTTTLNGDIEIDKEWISVCALWDTCALNVFDVNSHELIVQAGPVFFSVK